MAELGTKIFEAQPLDDVSAFATMRQAIILGQFTPFLGAGASSLRPQEPRLEEYPWCEIWSSILAVRDGLEKPSQLLYLRSFAKDRLGLKPDGRLRELDPTPEQMLRKQNVNKEPPREWPQEGVVDFQRSLVRLATEMGEVFGEAFARSYAAVSKITDVDIRIDPTAVGSTDVIGELLHLVDLASKLPDEAFPSRAFVRGRQKPPALKGKEIYKKLVMLAVTLVNSELWQAERLEGWRARHDRELDALPSGLSTPKAGEVAIRIEFLEWLPELLWYTLRYWTPCLPTTSEMAFDLSLKAFLAPPIKVELAQAAEALRGKPAKLADDIKAWFDYCHSRQVRLTRFHVAIASVLQNMYDMYRAREEEKRANQHIPAAEAIPSAYLPVAFTTNFDRSLERVFEELDISFHVVYPVRSRRGGSEARIKWKFSTHYSRDCPQKLFETEMSCDDLFNEDQETSTLVGPVIVKLHGSPLDSSGNDQHWLVLSELGYLEALDQRSKLPTWLERQLAGEQDAGSQEESRSLWFLGYSITDWNVRLRLYEHLRHGQNAGIGSIKRAVDKKLDSYRMAILGSLEIQLYVGDLNILPRMILNALVEIPRAERSSQLERLVAWLEEEQK
jgi:hypothetical protein